MKIIISAGGIGRRLLPYTVVLPKPLMPEDLLTLLNYSKLINFHKRSKALATIAAQKRSVPIDFGIIKSNSHNLVTRYIEKPRLFYQVSMGVYLFEPEILEYIPRHRKFDF